MRRTVGRCRFAAPRWAGSCRTRERSRTRSGLWRTAESSSRVRHASPTPSAMGPSFRASPPHRHWGPTGSWASERRRGPTEATGRQRHRSTRIAMRHMPFDIKSNAQELPWTVRGKTEIRRTCDWNLWRDGGAGAFRTSAISPRKGSLLASIASWNPAASALRRPSPGKVRGRLVAPSRHERPIEDCQCGRFQKASQLADIGAPALRYRWSLLVHER